MIGVVARLSATKGVDLAIAALALLRSRGQDAALAIAGDGPEEPALRRQAEAAGLADRVHFLGRVADVGALYRALDCVMIPSRDGAEGLPNVLLEAMSTGLPVVATRVAAVPEVLVDELAGSLCRPVTLQRSQRRRSEPWRPASMRWEKRPPEGRRPLLARPARPAANGPLPRDPLAG